MKFLGILAAIGLFVYNPASAAPCDITSTASVKIKSIVTTLNSAVINYTEGRTNGGRTIQYGIGTLGAAKSVQKRTKSEHPETINGLTANSKYMFQINGVWKGKAVYNKTSGNFTTDGSTCGDVVATTGKVEGWVVNQLGDSIPEVPVYIDEAGKKIAFDTTDENGYYTFEVNPGSNYKVYASYSPYTAPAPATVPAVAIGKTNKLPNQVLTGAFQLSGLVRLVAGGPGVDNATVTVSHMMHGSMKSSATTDETGRFELGLLAGEYSVMAVLGAKGTPSAKSVPITTQSVKMADLILSGSSSIKIMPKNGKFIGSSKPGYKANGARQVNSSSNPAQVIRFVK